MDVFLSDIGALKDEYRETLVRENIEFEEGRHSEERILDADIVVKSPGIPPYAPDGQKDYGQEHSRSVGNRIRRKIHRREDGLHHRIQRKDHHYPSDISYTPESGLNVGLAGNVGKSLALQVARDPHDVYVIELSSFQLENMYDFKADIAVMMNITGSSRQI